MHMEALLAVEAMSSQYNVKGFRRLYDQLEIHIHGLKSLGVDSESYGNLSSVLVIKIAYCNATTYQSSTLVK